MKPDTSIAPIIKQLKKGQKYLDKTLDECIILNNLFNDFWSYDWGDEVPLCYFSKEHGTYIFYLKTSILSIVKIDDLLEIIKQKGEITKKDFYEKAINLML